MTDVVLPYGLMGLSFIVTALSFAALLSQSKEIRELRARVAELEAARDSGPYRVSDTG